MNKQWITPLNQIWFMLMKHIIAWHHKVRQWLKHEMTQLIILAMVLIIIYTIFGFMPSASGGGGDVGG